MGARYGVSVLLGKRRRAKVSRTRLWGRRILFGTSCSSVQAPLSWVAPCPLLFASRGTRSACSGLPHSSGARQRPGPWSREVLREHSLWLVLSLKQFAHCSSARGRTFALVCQSSLRRLSLSFGLFWAPCCVLYQSYSTLVPPFAPASSFPPAWVGARPVGPSSLPRYLSSLA